MIDNLAVGPPSQGFPGLPPREAVKKPREDSSGLFSRTLGDKVKPQAAEPGATGRKGPKEKEAKDGLPTATAPPKGPEPPGQKRATGAREQAIREFMDSFESEFGIPPTRIVEAMASIEPQKMIETPEATAHEVIGQLDLPPEEREKAMAMYAGLLSDLQRIDIAPKPAFVAAETATAAPQVRERFLLSQERKSAVNNAVDALNQKFWMSASRDSQGLPGSPGMMTADRFGGRMDIDAMAPEHPMEGTEGLASLSTSMPSEEISVEGARPELPVLSENLEVSAEEAAPKAPMTPDQMKRVLAEMKRAADQVRIEKALMQQSAQPNAQAPTLSAGMTVPLAQDQAAVQPMEAQVLPTSHAQTDDQGFGSSQEQNSGDSGGGRDFGAKTGAKDGAMKSLATANPAMPVPLKLEDVAAALRNPPPVAPVPMGAVDNESAVRQIMNQAQYLIKRGGGEMKVEMSPEGLGQLQLKVLVQDGKVNVQMAAESNEARKLIESSLPELRSSLAAHKLSVDHVKVDVVSGPSTDTQARNDANANPNSQHRDTRHFWNQFQESFGNRGQREGFLEMPSLSAYRRGRVPEPLQPTETRGAKSTERADGRGRGIDLVA